MDLHIVIDENNPIYQLLKLLGCDLAQEHMNRYDAFVLGLQFLFACFMLYLFCKMIYNLMIRMTRCVSSI